MKHITHLFVSIGFIIIPLLSFSQKTIVLPKDTFRLSNRKFYVVSVTDKRKNKQFIGELWRGAFKKTKKITVKGGVFNYLQHWFLSNFPKTSDNQSAVKVNIKSVRISQSETYSSETGRAFVEFEFVDPLDYKHDFYSEITEETDDALSTHPARLIEAFRECTRKYNKTVPSGEPETIKPEEDAVEIVFDKENKAPDTEKYDENPTRNQQKNNRNVIALGYQIGGYNLLGVDYEVRVHDYFGVHLGAGFIGFTGGVKIHTSPEKNSMFFNISWKDTGLGMYNGIALEAGDRWIWSKRRDFGLYYQAGLFILNHIDSDFEQTLYKGNSAPPVSLSLGVGVSW